MHELTPGMCPAYSNDIRLFRNTAKFIGSLSGRVADMGCSNSKSEYLSRHFDIEIDQIDCDFNFDALPMFKYDVVLCFEVIEHLQNPLLFMTNLKGMLKPGGVIYLSTPERIRILQNNPYHFIEMNAKHLDRWILSPLKLRVLRSTRELIFHSWGFYFTGLRPLLRMFLDRTRIYEVVI